MDGRIAQDFGLIFVRRFADDWLKWR